MSQHDYEIATGDANTGVTFRAAVNAALQALASNNSGATAPTTTYPLMLWPDTTNNLMKLRNAANTAWITLFKTDVAMTDLARSLLDDADAATFIATLGLSAGLITLSLPASVTISAFIKTLLDDADAATARVTLGCGDVPSTRQIIAGTGMSGGGTLAVDRTLSHAAHTGDVTGSTALTIGAAKVSQSKLKTSSGSVSKAAGTSGHLALPGGAYGFHIQQYSSSNTLSTSNCVIRLLDSSYIAVMGTTPFTHIYIQNGDSDTTLYVKQTYVTSSGEVFWIFVLRDKVTKKVISAYESPDHPCFGNGGKPLLMPHPFKADYDSEAHEIVVITPSQDIVDDIWSKQDVDGDGDPDLNFLEVLFRDYEIDEGSSPGWPTVPVTIKLLGDRDWKQATQDGEIVEVLKAPIPKPTYVAHKDLKLRV